MKLKLAFFLIAGLLININLTEAQNTEAKITFGDESEYKPFKDEGEYTFKAYNKIYYVFMDVISMTRTYSIVECDENTNNVTADAELTINGGSFGNDMTIEKIIGINNKAYVLISNGNKKTGKNRLLAKVLNKDLTIDETEIEITSFDYKKMMNSGNWIVSMSPDQKHLLVIGELPFEEKEIPSKVIYSYLDQNLKSEKDGDLTLSGENRRYNQYKAYLANNADFYIVRKGQTKNGDEQPTIFGANALKKGEPTAYMPLMGEGKNMFSYTSAILANNSFSMAGYYDERKRVSIGTPLVKGCFYYNSASCTEVKLSPILTPVEYLTALDIVEIGSMVYMVGESYKSRSESSTNPSSLESTYFYTHKDINAVGFENDGNKKIDVNIGRNFTDARSETELKPVAAMIKNKLAVFFIDDLGKYENGRNGYRAPMLVFINDNGLMESTLHFEKEFLITKHSHTFFTHIPYVSKNKIQMLMMENTDAKSFSIE